MRNKLFKMFCFGSSRVLRHASFRLVTKVDKTILKNPIVKPYFAKIYPIIERERKLFNALEIHHLIKTFKRMPSFQRFNHEDFLLVYKLNNFKHTTIHDSKAYRWLSRIDKRVAEGTVVDATAVYYFYLYVGSMVVEFNLPRKGKVIKRAVNLYKLHHSQ